MYTLDELIAIENALDGRIEILNKYLEEARSDSDYRMYKTEQDHCRDLLNKTMEYVFQKDKEQRNTIKG